MNKKKLGDVLLWFLAALNYGVVMKGNILQDLCMYVILTYTFAKQMNQT